MSISKGDNLPDWPTAAERAQLRLANAESASTRPDKAYIAIPEDSPVDIGGDVLVSEGAALSPAGQLVRVLDPRYDLRNHSPTGFAWGYGGSGPAQLALAILADVAGDEVALRLYQQFKVSCIGRLPRGAWQLRESEVLAWLNGREQAAS